MNHMLFPNKKLLLKIENLEKELAEFHRIQHDLKEEMNYFCLEVMNYGFEVLFNRLLMMQTMR